MLSKGYVQMRKIVQFRLSKVARKFSKQRGIELISLVKKSIAGQETNRSRVKKRDTNRHSQHAHFLIYKCALNGQLNMHIVDLKSNPNS